MSDVELDFWNKKWREELYNVNRCRVLLPYIEKGISRIIKESRAEFDEANQHESKEIRNVNVWLRNLDFFVGDALSITSCNEDVCNFAKKKAECLNRDFVRNRTELGLSVDESVKILRDTLAQFDIDPLPGLEDGNTDKDSKAADIARITNEFWWRRKLKRLCTVKVERFIRECGGVSKTTNVYCSDYSLKKRFQQKERNQNLLENMVAENDQGQSFIVADLAALGVSNPHIRAMEICARGGGFDRLAMATGSYDCYFLTITCPSAYHAFHIYGEPNKKWNHADPKQASEYLCGVWARVRAAWDREGIKAFGLRIAEPHHDGTPHWHMQLWFAKDKAERAVEIYEQHACLEDAEELEKAKDGVRFKALKMEPEQGSAIGYILKYILKNINGHIDFDPTKDFGDPVEMAARVEAWASIWGIRQFQQIGGPSVTVWRELRRLKEMDGIAPEEFEAIRAAADAGDWYVFCQLMGGPLADRKDQPIRACMIVKREINQYGEQILKIIGLVWNDTFSVPTRLFEWTVRMVRSDSEREAVRACGPPLAA